MNGRKTTVTEVSSGRGWFWVGMVVLLSCLSLFCSDAGAQPYDFHHTSPPTSGVYGIHDSNSFVPLLGLNFGHVTATADVDYAYGILHDNLSPTAALFITGQFPSSGIISGTAGDDQAYGLYSSGSIHTDGINGTITATADDYYAYALGSNWSMVINGDIGSDANIAATAGRGQAYGLYSWNGSIETGDIDGKISALVTGEGEPGSAYGIYADVNLTTGAINGNITAEETLGPVAYALYAGQDLTVDGNIGSDAHITAKAGTNNAFGLYSFWGNLTTGDIDGTIDANAVEGDYARGLFGWESITTGAIGGNITATAGGDWAAGLFSGDSLTVNGAIDGNIVANAGGDYARGLASGGDLTTGAINGNITATAGGDNAAGLFSYGSVTTGDVNGTIIATAHGPGNGTAYGIYASDNLTTGDVNGTITAEMTNGSGAYALRAGSDLTVDGNIGNNALISATATNGSDAYGLYSYNGTIYTGDINGTITAFAKTSNAAGLYTNGSVSIYTGAINGEITADANTGSNAYGLRSVGRIDIDGIGDNALISATAGQDNAYGLYSVDGPIDIDGDMNGVITATAGNNNAAGLYSMTGSITTGAINGTIDANATTGSDAYGLYVNGHLDVDGIGKNAEITATAGNDYAYGLYSSNGSLHIDGDMNGIITATAGDYKAAGLRSYNNLRIRGDIDGDVNATAGEHAFGLRSDNGNIYVEGVIDGNITATANNGDRAYGFRTYNGSIDTNDINGNITATAETDWAAGMRSSDDITTGAINGTIDANATTGSDAYGLYSNSGTIYTGDINGTITAFAKTDYAAGLYTNGPTSIYTGAINGTITADANTGSNAYGLYANGHLDVDGIGENALITATAGTSWAAGLYSANGTDSIHIDDDMNGVITARAGTHHAYGLYSDGSITIAGDVNGTITATAGTNNAAGLYSENGSIETGDVNGTITATAEDDRAYGFRSYGSLNITGDIGNDANISATAGDDRAYGLYSETSSIDTQAINGMISAAAGTDNASGLYSVSKSITTGAINGTIRATAEQDRAFGFRSYESIYITGDIGIDANITATAGDDRAHGLYSENGSITTQAINGTISATAGNDRAYGLYSENGSITTGAIRGIIDANAGGDFAYGILSYDKMIVTVDGGTVSAVAHGGTNVAAIQSGRISSGGLSTQDAADTVEIVAGSTIVGDIDLAMDGTDNDELWLTGDTGTTTLDDDIWNVENIYITGGTWYFNGNVYNSNVELNGGVLSPGGSIGSMTIDGDLTIGSGGTYEVDVNNSEDHDYVGVTGTAYLGGTLRGNVYGGERIDHSFNVNVLDADTINGAFANVTGTTLFPIFDVGSGSVILQVIMDYAYYADTDNQHSVGEAFNDVVTEGLDDTDDDMNEVLTAIEGLDEATINGAYNQMMPQDALGQAEIIRNAMNQYSESVFGRMDNVRNGRQYAMSADSRYLLASMDNAMALPPKTDEWMPFAKGFGVWGDRNAESDIAGYQYNIYGMAGGVDKLVSDNTLIGISVAGSRANIDYSQAGTSSDIDSMFCSLYGSYFVDDWHVGLTLGYGHSWYDSQRSITFTDPDRRAESDHQGNSYSAAVELGKNLGDKSMILEPVAGIGYTAVQESGYTEKGADALNLKVDSTTADGIYGKLGVRVAKEFRPEQNPGMILVPNVSAFWVHDFADRVELSSSFVGGGSFTTQGLEPMRDTFNIGAGLNVYYNKNLRLFVDYGWQSASNFNSNTVQLGAQWSF